MWLLFIIPVIKTSWCATYLIVIAVCRIKKLSTWYLSWTGTSDSESEGCMACYRWSSWRTTTRWTATTTEWTSLLDQLTDSAANDRTLPSVYKLLHTEDIGLAAQLPLLTRLYAVAITLLGSTAGVERVFSQLKLMKTAHLKPTEGANIADDSAVENQLQTRVVGHMSSHSS